MKLCNDCHNIVKDFDWRKSRCLAQENQARIYTEPVSGTQVTEWIFPNCLSARTSQDGCGLEANWFKQREEPPRATTVPPLGGRKLSLSDLEIEL